jgi:hypothetical protein
VDWTQAVDIYCERTIPGFWNEPFNAWSNLAFVAAAAWAAIVATRRGLPYPALWALIALAALIGVGSFLFHTFANRWSELADTFPIWIFVAGYTLAAMRWIGGMAPDKVARWAWIVMGAGVALAAYTGLEGGTPPPDAAQAPTSDPFNGSLQYLPALAALAVFSVITWRRQHPLSAWVWAATAAFFAALTFRSLDVRVCDALPIGVHFMWHVMNGLMIALLLQLLARAMDSTRSAAP